MDLQVARMTLTLDFDPRLTYYKYRPNRILPPGTSLANMNTKLIHLIVANNLHHLIHTLLHSL